MSDYYYEDLGRKKVTIKFKEVAKLHHVDTSDTQSEQILREIRQQRNDAKNSAIDIVDALKGGKFSDSPYVSDRKHLDPNRVYQSPTENSWKQVTTQDQNRNRVLNLKKLDIY